VKRSPRSELALDPAAVLARIAGPVEAWAGIRPARCRARLLKQTERRLVVRYDIDAGGRPLSVIGKWFATDRGALVAEALSLLRKSGFAGPETAVPAPIAYLPDLRALFVEAVEGMLLRVVLLADPSAAARAGAWLAAFHRAPFTSSRSCGPEKQVRAVGRWASESPALAPIAPALAAALSALPDPSRPVHYDYYHSQVLVPDAAPTVVLDLDEAGLGDPAFDLAHFETHLELLALQWLGDPGGLQAACDAFRTGYGDSAPEPPPALRAFAWFKLARNLIARGAPPSQSRYASEAVERNLASA